MSPDLGDLDLGTADEAPAPAKPKPARPGGGLEFAIDHELVALASLGNQTRAAIDGEDLALDIPAICGLSGWLRLIDLACRIITRQRSGGRRSRRGRRRLIRQHMVVWRRV